MFHTFLVGLPRYPNDSFTGKKLLKKELRTSYFLRLYLSIQKCREEKETIEIEEIDPQFKTILEIETENTENR